MISEKIEEIKKNGIIRAFKNQIDKQKNYVTGSCFSNISDCGKYCRLAAAIKDAEEILQEMKQLLKELQSYEPENK